jgi:hypothetical protein
MLLDGPEVVLGRSAVRGSTLWRPWVGSAASSPARGAGPCCCLVGSPHAYLPVRPRRPGRRPPRCVVSCDPPERPGITTHRLHAMAPGLVGQTVERVAGHPRMRSVRTGGKVRTVPLYVKREPLVGGVALPSRTSPAGAEQPAVQPFLMDDRIQQGRDPEWRLAFEDRLDDAARVRVHRAVRNGDSVGDPDEAAVAAGFARRLAVWAKAGVFEQLHLDVLDRSGWPAGWTGRAPAWTRPACAPSVGGPRWRKSGRPGQAREQAPSGLRGRRAAAGRGGDRR